MKKKTGHFPRLQGFRKKFAGIDATGRDFRFAVTLGSCRLNFPRM
jgi:hypothetical protein